MTKLGWDSLFCAKNMLPLYKSVTEIFVALFVAETESSRTIREQGISLPSGRYDYNQTFRKNDENFSCWVHTTAVEGESAVAREKARGWRRPGQPWSWCLAKRDIREKVLGHLVQAYFFTSAWVCWWARRLLLSAKDLWHWVHSNGFSPVWVRKFGLSYASLLLLFLLLHKIRLLLCILLWWIIN